MKLRTRNLILALTLALLAIALYVFTIVEVVNTGGSH